MHQVGCIGTEREADSSLAGGATVASPPAGFLPGKGRVGLVSVVIPAFNRQELVLDAVRSIASQTYQRTQIIVVDDGSVDATAQVVRDWARSHPDQWLDLICQKNCGVAAARNAGLRHAEGEYIYFLDSDDVAEPTTLAIMVHKLNHAPSSPFALARVCNTDTKGALIPDDYSGDTHMREWDVLRNHWLLFAALYRRSALRLAGPFNEELTMGEDTEINWRVILVNGAGIRCGAVLGKRRHHLYGHLYIDSDDTEKMRRSLEMHEALGRWLAQHPQHQDKVAVRGLWAVHNYYHRLGLKEGEELWEKVAGLFDRVSPQTPVNNAILRWFSRPQNRPIYRQLYRLYRMPRNMAKRVLHIVANSSSAN